MIPGTELSSRALGVLIGLLLAAAGVFTTKMEREGQVYAAILASCRMQREELQG